MVKKIEKVRELLSNTLKATFDLPHTQETSEIRQHLKKAMIKLEESSSKETKRKINNTENYKTWWGHIEAGSHFAKMSQEAAVKSLNQLNAMISQEQSKIDEIINKAADMSGNSDSHDGNNGQNSEILFD